MEILCYVLLLEGTSESRKFSALELLQKSKSVHFNSGKDSKSLLSEYIGAEFSEFFSNSDSDKVVYNKAASEYICY